MSKLLLLLFLLLPNRSYDVVCASFFAKGVHGVVTIATAIINCGVLFE